jgi:hypothetical protein
MGEVKEGSEGVALASVDISGGGHGTRTFLRHVAVAKGSFENRAGKGSFCGLLSLAE